MGVAILVAAGIMATMATIETFRLLRRPQAERLEVVLALAVLAFAAASDGMPHAVALAASVGLLARPGRRLRAQPSLLAWPLLLLGLATGAAAYFEAYRAAAHAAAAVIALTVAATALSHGGRAKVLGLGVLAVAAWNGLEAAPNVDLAPWADWAALTAALLLAPALAPPPRLRRLLVAERLQEAAAHLVAARGAQGLFSALPEAARIALDTDRAGVFLPGSGEAATWAMSRQGPVKAKDVPAMVRRHCPGAHRHGVVLAPIGEDPYAVLWGVPDASGLPSDAADTLMRLADQAEPLIEQAALLEDHAGQAAAAQGQVEHKSRLLGALAHELGNPLSPIRLQVTVLERRGEDPAVRAKIGAVIDRNVERLTKLIEDMRTAAQVEEGRLDLDLRPTPLRPLVEQALDAHRDLAEQRGCELVLRQMDDADVLADATRLGQVLDNLVNNAIKYSPEGGPVHIDCIQEHGQVLVAVQDQGLGLDEEQQAKVLGAYERVHTDTGIKGTGLGLAIVQGIIEGHGGHLRVYSPGPGQGCTFSFRIPTA